MTEALLLLLLLLCAQLSCTMYVLLDCKASTPCCLVLMVT
jgi:hypothetical protein